MTKKKQGQSQESYEQFKEKISNKDLLQTYEGWCKKHGKQP